MNLPNYFLADLPPEAMVNAQMITDACQTLRHNRERYLASRSTASLVEALCELGRHWLQPESPFRQQALRLGPAATGFGEATLANGLTSFFRQFTPANFQFLLEQEFGHPGRSDALTSTPTEHRACRAAFATGPEMLVHIAAGNLPNPTWMSIVLGVLVRSAQFVKCASGTALLPRLFAHSLYHFEPKIGACLEIAEWKGGHATLESALFAEADCVTATGSDEALMGIRSRLGPKTRWIGYGHRLSFGYVSRGAFTGWERATVVANAAKDVAAWNQLGCLSPHLFYVEHGNAGTAEQFAGDLAAELAKLESSEPRGPVPIDVAAAIRTRRSFYEVRAAHSPNTLHWFSPDSTAWTVIYEGDAQFQTSCLHRFVYVKGVADLAEALHGADAVRGKVSTVGLAATEDEAPELANQLARWGAPRICRVGQMQNPPLAWRHDGRPSLGDLVTWSDFES